MGWPMLSRGARPGSPLTRLRGEMGPTAAAGASLPATAATLPAMYPCPRMLPTPGGDTCSIPISAATPVPLAPAPSCSPGWDGENRRSWGSKAGPPVPAGDAAAPSPSSRPAAA